MNEGAKHDAVCYTVGNGDSRLGDRSVLGIANLVDFVVGQASLRLLKRCRRNKS